MGNILMLFLALGIILLGATVFTNGLEWFGKKMNLSDGAVGSIFAAIGTALPETLVPIIAILFGSREAGQRCSCRRLIPCSSWGRLFVVFAAVDLFSQTARCAGGRAGPSRLRSHTINQD